MTQIRGVPHQRAYHFNSYKDNKIPSNTKSWEQRYPVHFPLWKTERQKVAGASVDFRRFRDGIAIGNGGVNSKTRSVG